MKKEILTLIIGILIGAIITTGVFLVLKGDSSSVERGMKGNMEDMGEFPEMDGTRPTRPNESNTTEDATNSSESNI